MVYADEDDEMSLYEKDDLRNWQGKNMPVYTCVKCHKSCFTSNLKTANSDKCEYCGGKLINVGVGVSNKKRKELYNGS